MSDNNVQPLILPWPHKDLSPNARGHWGRRMKATKQARNLAFILARKAGWNPALSKQWAPDAPVALHVYAHPPDRRHRDDDNLGASCKAYRDGIADALGINDSRFRESIHMSSTTAPGGELRAYIYADMAG